MEHYERTVPRGKGPVDRPAVTACKLRTDSYDAALGQCRGNLQELQCYPSFVQRNRVGNPPSVLGQQRTDLGESLPDQCWYRCQPLQAPAELHFRLLVAQQFRSNQFNHHSRHRRPKDQTGQLCRHEVARLRHHSERCSRPDERFLMELELHVRFFDQQNHQCQACAQYLQSDQIDGRQH